MNIISTFMIKVKLKIDWNILHDKRRYALIEGVILFLLSISPLLQHYKGPLVNAGITLLVILTPFIFVIQLIKLKNVKSHNLYSIIPLVVFAIYKLIAHGFTFLELGHTLIVIFYFFVAASQCISTKRFLKFASYVAIVSSILIIIQYLCYYILGFHLQLVPTSLLLPKSEIWVLLAQTGRVSVTGRVISFYRPSAFFLEPSHMFLYLFPIQLILLLSPGVKPKQTWTAVLLSLGLILSTSGMGIVTTVCAWVLYFIIDISKNKKLKIKNLFSWRNILILLTFIGGVVLLYLYVPFLQKSIGRIWGAGGATGAISGRTRAATNVIKGLTGISFWFGVADTLEGVNVHMPGLMATMYKYGLVGVVLSYIFYGLSMFKLKGQYFWVSLLIIAVSFFSAHTHGTFYMLYFVYILLEGFRVQELKDR